MPPRAQPPAKRGSSVQRQPGNPASGTAARNSAGQKRTPLVPGAQRQSAASPPPAAASGGSESPSESPAAGEPPQEQPARTRAQPSGKRGSSLQRQAPNASQNPTNATARAGARGAGVNALRSLKPGGAAGGGGGGNPAGQPRAKPAPGKRSGLAPLKPASGGATRAPDPKPAKPPSNPEPEPEAEPEPAPEPEPEPPALGATPEPQLTPTPPAKAPAVQSPKPVVASGAKRGAPRRIDNLAQEAEATEPDPEEAPPDSEDVGEDAAPDQPVEGASGAEAQPRGEEEGTGECTKASSPPAQPASPPQPVAQQPAPACCVESLATTPPLPPAPQAEAEPEAREGESRALVLAEPEPEPEPPSPPAPSTPEEEFPNCASCRRYGTQMIEKVKDMSTETMESIINYVQELKKCDSAFGRLNEPIVVPKIAKPAPAPRPITPPPAPLAILPGPTSRPVTPGSRPTTPGLPRDSRPTTPDISPEERAWMARFKQQTPDHLLLTSDNPPNLTAISSSIEKLRSFKRMDEADNGYQFTLDTAIETLKATEGMMRSSHLHSSVWIDAVSPLLVMLGQVIKQKPVKESLANVEEEIRRALFEVDERQNAKANAAIDGNVEAIEALSHELISAEEQVAALIQSQLTILDKVKEETFKLPHNRLKDGQNTAQGKLSGISLNHQRLREEGMADLENLERELEIRIERQRVLDRTTEEEVAKSHLEMSQNWRRQEECWNTILDSLQELQQLSQQGQLEANTRAMKLEDLRNGQEELALDKARAATRRERLRDCLEKCETGEQVTTRVSECISTVCNTMEFELRQRDTQAEEEKLQVRQNYLKEFRRAYITLGEITYSKEQNAKQLEAKIQEAQQEQDFYALSLNPKARGAADERKRLTQQHNELLEKITAMKSQGSQMLIEFKPVEKALTDGGVSFLHPKEELEQVVAKKDLKMVAYHGLTEAAKNETNDYIMEGLTDSPSPFKKLTEPLPPELRSPLANSTSRPPGAGGGYGGGGAAGLAPPTGGLGSARRGSGGASAPPAPQSRAMAGLGAAQALGRDEEVMLDEPPDGPSGPELD